MSAKRLAQNGPQTQVSVNRTQVCRHSFKARGVPLFFATVLPPVLQALQAVAAVRGPIKKRPVARTGRFQYGAIGLWQLWLRPGLAAQKRLLQERQHALGLLVGLCQHRSRRLLDDLRFRQLGRCRRIVRIHDGTA